ncbi:MAG: endonuclease MutS2 [Lachnospiraceae bacterium]|nr:endonuclease MutS2 [Lachnospiraceae bacterium]
MKEKTLRTLEYHKIIERLSSCAGSACGKERCRETLPLTDLGEIERLQEETQDALSRIYAHGSLYFSGIHDIRAAVKRLDMEAGLSAGELLHIGSLLTAVKRIRDYGAGDEREDSLTERFRMLEPLVSIANEIDRCIISEEEIADDASPGLKNVRRQMRLTNDRIRDRLSSIVSSNDNKTYLQDNIITMRDGRFCIPVKSEYKNRFPGMIHDQSSKGSTTFIEPLEIVTLNNELRELAVKEQEEIKKVLKTLSEMLVPHVQELEFDTETLTAFDVIFARAMLAKSMKASRPVFGTDGMIDIRKGRHPLIDPAKVVPIDIRLGGDFTMLVITGPNTGGKTVSLKTVGLFTLMGQSGLHIPAFDGSRLSVFDNVYADIGDEQSIEQSLSTFSSHMTNTVSILREADEGSLVLFDELGAGTDPTEGAALARAILSYLHERCIHVMATTHYAELKAYALSEPGVCNACCEFDVATLSPTYKLLIGVPGRSNAFAISGKLGLPEELIARARGYMTQKEKSLDDVIEGLSASRLEYEQKNEKASETLGEAERLKERLAQKNEKLDATREKIIENAREEAEKILREAKEFADTTIRKINKLAGSGAPMRELEEERGALRDRLSGAERKKKSASKKPGTPITDPSQLKIGDNVHVISLNVDGKIVSLPGRKGEVTVSMGAMRTIVNVSDLETAEAPPEQQKSEKTGVGAIKIQKAYDVGMSVNVIGMRVDEALPVVEKYLDDAYLAGLQNVSVIHGRGTGALKDAVHGLLKRLKYVSSYRFGTFHEGDRGVTIVEFKQGN